MFSVQLHIDLNTPLGKRLSLLQHLMAVAMVNAVLSVKGYEVSRVLDLNCNIMENILNYDDIRPKKYILHWFLFK